MSEDNDSSPELTVITYDIICAFQDRGYSLFSVGLTTSVVPLSPQLLDDIITFGPEEKVLDAGIRYIPLPLVDKDQRQDPKAIRAAAEEMARQMRGPYFVDLKTNDDNSVEPVGIYLVDSLLVQAPCLYLVIDSRFGSGAKGSIELPVAVAAWKIRKQLMLALR